MSDLAFFALVATTVLFLGVCVPFLRALQEEAPDIYLSLGSPSVATYVWKKKLLMPFSRMVLLREYRQKLISFPRSKAWASWLFVAHWLQFAALGWFLATLFLPARS
jgi:hypothetical protein